MSPDDLIHVNQKFVIGEIFLFNIIGIFGNLNLIWSTLRKKDMRNKPGVLLTVTATFHILCLLSEFVNVAFLVRGQPIVRTTCLPYLIPYMFVISAQAVMSLTLAFDVLTAVLFPLKYMKWNIYPYSLIACIPATLYGTFIVVCMIVYRDDAVIPFCNPPLVLVPAISRVWSMSNVVINSIVVATYIVIIIVVKCRAGRSNVRQEQRRVIRRLQVVALVFVFSWYICLLGVDIGVIFPESFRPFWQSNMVFFALICYSQTFYVCLWRSVEYRRLFVEQMGLLGFNCNWKVTSEPSMHSRSQIGDLTKPNTKPTLNTIEL